MCWLTKSWYGEVSLSLGTDAKQTSFRLEKGNLIAKFRGPNEQGFYSREGKE